LFSLGHQSDKRSLQNTQNDLSSPDLEKLPLVGFSKIKAIAHRSLLWVLIQQTLAPQGESQKSKVKSQK
jgi:hypothetical protein